MADDNLSMMLAAFLMADHGECALNRAMASWIDGGDPVHDPDQLLRQDLPDERMPAWFAADALRRAYIDRFGFAVPTPDLVARLAALGPILEIGAGRGTLARLVANAGGDILATDLHPETETHYPVRGGEAAETVVDHPDQIVLCSWPSLDGRWFTRAAAAMTPGQTLVLVGERNGCTGAPCFWDSRGDRSRAIGLPRRRRRLVLPRHPRRSDGLPPPVRRPAPRRRSHLPETRRLTGGPGP